MNCFILVYSKLQNVLHGVCITTKHMFGWDNGLDTGKVDHMTRIIRRGYKTAYSVVFGDFRAFSCCY